MWVTRRLTDGLLALCCCAMAASISPALPSENHTKITSAAASQDRFGQSESGLYLYLAHPDLERFRQPYMEGLSQDYIDGIAIVVQWDRLEPRPGVFDWSDLDRWVNPTVSRGKKLSVGIIAGFFTPAWLYQHDFDVPKNDFVFDPSHTGKTCKAWSQPSVWNATFLREYATVLAALADHLRRMQIAGGATGSAFRALTVIKLSGINNTTEELRVDSTKPSADTCHESDAAAIWAKAGLTPKRIAGAVQSIAATTAGTFPGQKLGLAVIHKFAFPEIDDNGQRNDAVSIPNAVTIRVLQSLVPVYGRRLIIQWNALWQGAPPPEVVQAEKNGASIGWQMNGFLGPWVGSGCIYPGWSNQPCRSVTDFHSILDNGINLGASYIEVQLGSVLNKAWRPAFEAAHARLHAALAK